MGIFAPSPAGDAAPDAASLLQRHPGAPAYRPCPPGAPRLIGSASPHVFAGYRGAPAATDESLVIAPDGTPWLVTADVGTLDGGGALRFLGRAGDAVRSGGETVRAAEVEGAVCAEEAPVEACAVVPVLDARWGGGGGSGGGRRRGAAAGGGCAGGRPRCCVSCGSGVRERGWRDKSNRGPCSCWQMRPRCPATPRGRCRNTDWWR